MFDPGKILKVKVEVAPGEFGYGRATIVDRQGSQIVIQIKTAKDNNKQFGKGTRLWFTNDSPKVTFNGMWASSVVGTVLVQGKNMLVCASPRHEPLAQKRVWQRVAIELPVKLTRPASGERKEQHFQCNTADISRSGLTVELSEALSQSFEPDEEVALVISSKNLDIAAGARIIRVDRHWIANKTILGLEFYNLLPPGQQELDKLLVPLGGRPRDPELEEEARRSMGSGMAAWSKTVKNEDRDRFAIFEDGHENSLDDTGETE